jgi:hypothetical protein
MMETLKRHAFLVALIAGVAVIGAAVLILVYVFETRSNAVMRQKLQTIQTRANSLATKPRYTTQLVDDMIKDNAQGKGFVVQRQAEYAALLDFIRDEGANRKPVTDNLFPQSTETNLRHQFKSEYAAFLDKLAKRLDAQAPPSLTEKETKGEPKTEPPTEGFQMYYHPDLTFVRPDWLTKPEAPSLENCRIAQENLWLMEDLVGVIAKMEADLPREGKTVAELRKEGKPNSILTSPVKELVEIKIGGEASIIPGSKMVGISGRYVPTAAESKGSGSTRAPTLTGRWSQPDEKRGNVYIKLGMYKVLPWRMTVVLESRYAGELVRRLTGTESFLTVDAIQMKPITEYMFQGSRDELADSRKMYGTQGVVLLEVVGESLVFQLEGGRLTTPLVQKEAKPAEKAPAGKTPAKG